MVGDRSGGEPVRWLGWLVAVLACLAVVGGAVCVWAHQTSDRDAEGQDRYGEVQQAASDEVVALLNIDYRDSQATIDRVTEGTTGEFKKQFETSTGGLVDLTTNAKSVMTGEVLWAGVVDLDQDSATVIVATTGTVTNTVTGGETAARNFRIKVELVLEGGRWLTSGLEFVTP